MKNSTLKGVRLLSVAGSLTIAALGACTEEGARAVDDDDGSSVASGSGALVVGKRGMTSSIAARIEK